MLPRILIFSAFLGLMVQSDFLHGQPVYPSSAYANPGETHIVTKIYVPQLSLHYSTIQRNGANRTWDFRFMQGLVQRKRTFYDPSFAFDYAAAYIALCTQSCMGYCPGNCATAADDCRNNCSGPFSAFCIAGCNTQEQLCIAACPATCAIQCIGNTTNWDIAERRFRDIDFNPIIPFAIKDSWNIMSKTNDLTVYAMAGRLVSSLLPLPGTGFPILIPYDDPDKILEFPITYGQSFTDSSSYKFDLGLFSNVVNIGLPIAYEVKSFRTTEVTGWGTIRTPYGDFNNALKVRTTVSERIRLWVNGIEIDSDDFPGILTPDNSVEYMWFDAAAKIPVFRVWGNEKWGIETYTDAEYLDNPFAWPFREELAEEMNEEMLFQNAVTIFPNPFDKEINIQISGAYKEPLIAEMYNHVGQLVHREEIRQNGENSTTHRLDLSSVALSSGLYIVKVQAGNRLVKTEKVTRF